IAWPLAYVLMDKWLQGFAYRVSIGFGLFIFSAVLVLAIALITVIYQVGKAALSNPVDILKYE
ncbi:MAG: cell division protein FtsX, partial [bacterium]|nr:cell division protein FtsX [bacterium]